MVRSGRDGNADKRRRRGVECLDAGFDVLARPVVLVVSAGVEAQDKRVESRGNDQLAVAAAVFGVPELLIV